MERQRQSSLCAESLRSKRRISPTRLVSFVSLNLALVLSLYSCWHGLSNYDPARQALVPRMERLDHPVILSPTKEVVAPLPTLVGDNVFLLDVVWVPQESKLVLLAMAKSMFLGHKNPKYDKWKSKAYNMTFPYDSIRSPISLVPHLSWNNAPIKSCNKIRAEASDSNINYKMHILHCLVDSKSSTVNHLKHQNTILARFDAEQDTFNAASAMKFDRTQSSSSLGGTVQKKQKKPNKRISLALARFDVEQDTFNAASAMKFDRSNSSSSLDGTVQNQQKKPNKQLSVAVMPVSSYSPLVPDLLDYYQKQGVAHVYFGVIDPSPRLLRQYRQAFENFKGFVSLGWFNSTDVVFDYSRKDGHVLLKTMFSNSVLHHAGAFQDDFLMVADLDDVLVSNRPTKTSIVDELTREINSDACYGVISPRVLWRHDKAHRNSTRLGERFPKRCKNVGVYEKSVAVLKNCQFVGIHVHGACIQQTKAQKIDAKQLHLHHYMSWWGKERRKCDPRDKEVPSELGTFQRLGFVHDTNISVIHK